MFKWDNIKKVSGVLAILLVFGTFIFGVVKLIDWRIDQRLHSEETLSSIDKRIELKMREEGSVNYFDSRVEKKVHDEIITGYIDSRVNKSITSPNFIGKVRHNIKPTAIFNSDGSVIANMGAMGYISDIKVEKAKYKTYDKIFKIKIIVSPKEFLNVAPMLESLDGTYRINSKRGNRYDWIYMLEPIVLLSVEESAQTSEDRFRIEILN